MTTLEKIRAEIAQLENPCSKEHGCIAEVLQIIDKYAEQEPMREFTEEEAKAYSKALDKMYKPTGFNVFNEPCDKESEDKE